MDYIFCIYSSAFEQQNHYNAPMRKGLTAKQTIKSPEKGFVMCDLRELQLPINLGYSNYCSLSTKKRLYHKFYLSKRTSQTYNQNPFQSRFLCKGGNVTSQRHQIFKVSPSKIYDKSLNQTKTTPKQQGQKIRIYRHGKLVKERKLFSSYEGQRNDQKITSFQAKGEGLRSNSNQIFITQEQKQKRLISRKQLLRTEPSFLRRSRSIMGEQEEIMNNNWVTLSGWETAES